MRRELARLVDLQVAGKVPVGRYDAAMRLVLDGWSAASAVRSVERRRPRG